MVISKKKKNKTYKRNTSRRSKVKSKKDLNRFVVFFEIIRGFIFKNLVKTFLFLGVFLLVMIILIGEMSSDNNNLNFNRQLQTSLISQLQGQVSNLQSLISRRQTCRDTPWKPLEGNVCRGVEYEKTTTACGGFSPPEYIETVGSAICCDGYEAEKMLPCPGGNIFLENTSRSNWPGVRLIATRSDCKGFRKCQFFPDPSKYHAKVDAETGDYEKEDNGNVIIEKNCKESVKVGECNKGCGGGERTVSTKFKNCVVLEYNEFCNMDSCFSESVN